MTQLLPPKKDVALALLERSNVDVYLDPRSEGVVVPPQFRKEPRLILKIGLNMHVPIPDLRVDDDSMSCTLSFSRTPFYCVVPWSSVFAMVGEDGRGMVWPDDVPQELAVKSEGAAPKAPAPGAKKEGPKVALAPAPPGDETRRNARRSKLTDASAPSSASAKGKRAGKKKKDEARPVLMAVPAPAPSAPVLTEVGRSAEPASKPVHPQDDVAAKPAAAPPATVEAPAPSRPSPPSTGPSNGRPKRELPPYLRVVK